MTHKNVQMALCAAQAAMGRVVKGSVNPAFKSRYADLADVMSVALPALTAEGICVFHSIIREDGQSIMRTTFSHGESETAIHCDVPLIVMKNDMQGMKSATTYAKRIGVESLSGIAPEDDDGNAASKSAPVTEPARDNGQSEREAIAYLRDAETLADLAERWGKLPVAAKTSKKVMEAKDAAKAALSQPVDDAIPY